MSKHYNTPHRTHIIKTRLTEEEHADFMERLTAYGMSQSEFIRQAIRGVTVKSIINVSCINDELLAAIGRLTGEYGKISNLNQIARYLNEFGAPYNALSTEVRSALSDIAALKFQVLHEVKENSKNLSTLKSNGNEDLALLPQSYLDTDIYRASRKIKKMQKLNSSILTTWYEIDDADEMIE